MKYTCLRCNKEFKQKIHFTNHNNRIRPCKVQLLNEPLNENDAIAIIPDNKITSIENNLQISNNLQCEYCMRQFKRQDYLQNHINLNRCKMKQMINKQNSNKDHMIELLMQQIEEKDKMIQENKKNQEQILELTKTIQKMESKMIKTSNTNTNNLNSHNTMNNSHNTNNYIIKLGDEDINKLTNKELEFIINKQRSSIRESIRITNFNKRIPENHSVYVSDRKFKYGLVYNNNDKNFQLKELNDVVNDLIDTHIDNIKKYLKKKNLKYTPQSYKAVVNLLKQLDKTNEESTKIIKAKIIDEIKIMMYNNKNIVIKTHKNLDQLSPIKLIDHNESDNESDNESIYSDNEELNNNSLYEDYDEKDEQLREAELLYSKMPQYEPIKISRIVQTL